MFLMHWESVLAFWSQSDQYRHIDQIIHPAYSRLWFGTARGNDLRFLIGEVCYMNSEWPLAFVNGTHRTRVLAASMRAVPLAARAGVYRRKLLSRCIIQEIAKDDYLDLPDLPVHEPQKLRHSYATHNVAVPLAG